jgi:hypothetical protein
MCWSCWTLSAGWNIYHITVLAFFAVVVTIWPPETKLGKAFWLVIFFSLMGFEMLTIYHERTENQRQQAGIRKAFAEILNDNQTAFDIPMGKMKDLAATSEKAVNEITGGDGYIYLEPGEPSVARLAGSYLFKL